MDIETRTHGFELTPALAERVEHHVRSALDPMSDRITRVTVRLDDVNGGTRGGVDKRCRVVVALAGHGTAVADVTSADLYAAIDDAARRVRRSATRLMTRHVGRERNDPQRPGVLVRP